MGSMFSIPAGMFPVDIRIPRIRLGKVILHIDPWKKRPRKPELRCTPQPEPQPKTTDQPKAITPKDERKPQCGPVKWQPFPPPIPRKPEGTTST